jgi:Eukaryotic translation initiation factor eIF2A
MGPPALEIAALSSKQLSILSGPPNVGKELHRGPAGTEFEYAPDGSRFVQCDGASISFYTAPEAEPVKCKADSPVARLCFSPTGGSHHEPAAGPLMTMSGELAPDGSAEWQGCSVSPQTLTMRTDGRRHGAHAAPAHPHARARAGKFCITHEAVIERLGAAHKNLRIWRTANGANVASFHKKGITNDSWPAIQFDAAETHVFFTVKDAIVLYDLAGDMAKATRKVKMEGVEQFLMGPAKRKVMATFTPESSKPAVFAIIEWDEGGTTINRKQFFRVRARSGGGLHAWAAACAHHRSADVVDAGMSAADLYVQTCARAACMRNLCGAIAARMRCHMTPNPGSAVLLSLVRGVQASRCKLHWNCKGTHVVCQSISDFDATNQSYFGESRLYMLSVDGKVDTAITVNDDTNIVDVAWSPSGSDFVAIGGHQPATAVLFDLNGKPICTIGQGPFNTIRWSPTDRFLLLAGFGNLPGDVRLFERDGKTVATMGALKSECSVQVRRPRRCFACTQTTRVLARSQSVPLVLSAIRLSIGRCCAAWRHELQHMSACMLADFLTLRPRARRSSGRRAAAGS